MPLLHPRYCNQILSWVLLIALTEGCGGSASNSVPFGAGLPVATATPELHTLEQQLFERVNRDRAQKQLSPLRFDPALADIARSHSADMRDNHYFEHESPRFGLLEARLNRAGYLFINSRENLAEAPTVSEAEEGLLKSPHHYENLMATDITHVGVGIVKGGVQDPRNLTVTQIFATPGKQESDAVAVAAIDGAIHQARKSAGVPRLNRHPRLDALARDHLNAIAGDLDGAQLKDVSVKAAEALAKSPLPGTKGVSIGAQIVVDSSQFVAEGATMAQNARFYGLAVDHGGKGGKTAAKSPRLRVLLIVGLR